MVSVLAYYSDDPSSNTAEDNGFSVKCCLKRTKLNKKNLKLTHLKNHDNIFLNSP